MFPELLEAAETVSIEYTVLALGAELQHCYLPFFCSEPLLRREPHYTSQPDFTMKMP